MTETPFGVLLERFARADADRPAITCEGESISRARPEARTNRLARAYRDLGVTPDSFVTIGLPNGIGFFEALIAVWKLGATPQPISSRLPASSMRCCAMAACSSPTAFGIRVVPRSKPPPL
jgi:bile acid-coenzyme A ligase